MTGDHPQQGDVILHACGGTPRWWVDGDTTDGYWCAACEGPILPEQPFRYGHASVFCRACGQWIGLCGRESVDGVIADAAAVVASRPAGRVA